MTVNVGSAGAAANTVERRYLDAGFDREANGLGGGRRPEPVKHQGAVHLDRLLADPELPGDLLVEQAARHQLEHLALAGWQLRDAPRGLGSAIHQSGRIAEIDLRA